MTELGPLLDFLEAASAVLTSASIPSKEGDPLRGIFLAEDRQFRERADQILRSFPRSRPIFLKVFRAFFRAFSRLKVEGLGHLPQQGPFILAPNHESYLDNLFVACLLPSPLQKDLAVLGAQEFLDRPLTRPFAKLSHIIPIDRKNVSTSVLQTGAAVLKLGRILLIHPEGTRSPDGKFLPLKSGVGILSCFAKCPIVPVYIEGAHEFWPKHSKWPQSRSRISVEFGPPIDPRRHSTSDSSDSLDQGASEMLRRLSESWMSMRCRTKDSETHTSRALESALPYSYR